MAANAQPPVAEKEKMDKDIEKTIPHSPGADDSSDVADSTLAALQRVRTADEHHPIHWSSLKKWNTVFWYCLLQAFVTLTTTTYVAAEFLVQEQFGGSTQVVALGQSMFIIGTAIGPAFLGPLSYVSRTYQPLFFFSPFFFMSCVVAAPCNPRRCCVLLHDIPFIASRVRHTITQTPLPFPKKKGK